MNKDICHLVYCPFTGLGIHKGYRGDGWLKNRIQIFKDFPIRSLLAQPEKNFVLWISWRPEERTNPQVIELEAYLRDKGFNIIFTYGGVAFWDDKYPNDKLLERLKATLPDLKPVIGDKKYVYMTIQPSDDTYWIDAIGEIQKQPYRYKGAYGYSHGYILNMRTLELAEYNPVKYYPPFYTIMFPTAEFLSPYQHYTYTGPYIHHGKIPDMFETINSQIRGFCVGIHGENISTCWGEPAKGRLLNKEETELIFKYFGITNCQPIKIRPHFWLIAKMIYVKLPKFMRKTMRSIFYLIMIGHKG